jgi:hypothetical protein
MQETMPGPYGHDSYLYPPPSAMRWSTEWHETWWHMGAPNRLDLFHHQFARCSLWRGLHRGILMARSVFHSSILPKSEMVLMSMLILVCMPARTLLAQHTVNHVGTVAPHPPAAPVYHAPISRPPMPMPVIPRPIVTYPVRVWPHASLTSPSFIMGGWRHPPRRWPPIVFLGLPFFGFGPGWGFNSCWETTCNLCWTEGVAYSNLPFYEYGLTNYVVSPYYEPTPYIGGEERPDLPQLFLKDGTIYNVTDYWLVDGELHFTVMEEAKSVEHTIAFDELDLQKTIDVNTARGFHFMLRNEPLEQYLRDHPDSTPVPASPPN